MLRIGGLRALWGCMSTGLRDYGLTQGPEGLRLILGLWREVLIVWRLIRVRGRRWLVERCFEVIIAARILLLLVVAITMIEELIGSVVLVWPIGTCSPRCTGIQLDTASGWLAVGLVLARGGTVVAVLVGCGCLIGCMVRVRRVGLLEGWTVVWAIVWAAQVVCVLIVEAAPRVLIAMGRLSTMDHRLVLRPLLVIGELGLVWGASEGGRLAVIGLSLQRRVCKVLIGWWRKVMLLVADGKWPIVLHLLVIYIGCIIIICVQKSCTLAKK